tara:strand:+ start:5685 stop:6530 length:846 start_codon:yes stop_codon:yes gene_type:complete
MVKYVPKGFTLLDEAYKIICGVEGELIDKDIPFTAEEKYFDDLMQERIAIISQCKAIGSTTVLPSRVSDIEDELEQSSAIVEIVKNKDEMQNEILNSCNYEIYMLVLLKHTPTWLVTDKKERVSAISLFKETNDYSNLFFNNKIDIVADDPDKGRIVKSGYLVINKKAIEANKEHITNELVKIYEQGLIDQKDLIFTGLESQMPDYSDALGQAIAHVHGEYKRMKLEDPNMPDKTIFALIKGTPFEIYPRLKNWDNSVFRQIKVGKFKGSIKRKIGPISLI